MAGGGGAGVPPLTMVHDAALTVQSRAIPAPSEDHIRAAAAGDGPALDGVLNPGKGGGEAGGTGTGSGGTVHPSWPAFVDWLQTRYNIIDPVRIRAIWRYFLDERPLDPADPFALPHRSANAVVRYFWNTRDVNPENNRPEWAQAKVGYSGPAIVRGTGINYRWNPGGYTRAPVTDGATVQVGGRGARAGWFYAREAGTGNEGWVSVYWLDFP